MTEKEALHILKCNSIEEVEDAFEDLIFNFKGKLLQIIPPLKILKATIKKIERISEAYNVFVSTSDLKKRVSSQLSNSLKLSDFLFAYQLKLAEIKLQLSSSESGESLVEAIELIIDLQERLFIKLANYLGSKKMDLDKFDIKLSENIDVFLIQDHLKELQLDDNKISEYIRKQINEFNIDDLSYLTKSVLNSAKQIEFNGIRREI